MKKRILLFILAVFLLGELQSLQAQIRVLICGGASTASWNNEVANRLMATGSFTTINIFQVNSGTPTLANLTGYDAVLVYSDFAYSNPAALGNVLAQYVDAGGGVVLATFDMHSISGWRITGAFDNATYRVMNIANQVSGTTRTLGTVHLPSHPLMSGVTSFNGGSGSYMINTTTVYPGSGAYKVASWSSGQVLIAARDNAGIAGNKKRVDVNFYPPSSDSHPTLWNVSTDGTKILRNALLYVASACGTTPPTITASGPTTFCAGGSVTLTASGPGPWQWNDGSITQSIVVTTNATKTVTTYNCISAPVTVTVTQPTTWYKDADNDGYGNAFSTVVSCLMPAGYVANSTDCNDGNALLYQNGTFFIDADGDGYTNGSTVVCYGATTPPGYSLSSLGPDCNDNNPALYQSISLFVDADNDGYTNGTAQVCYGVTIPPGYTSTSLGSDCNDNNPAIQNPVQYFIDSDLDGYGSVNTALVCALTPPAGYSLNNSDCNDASASIHPGAAEVCNGTDDDCDTFVDDGDPSVSGQPTWYADTDLDGYGDPASTLVACIQPPGYLANSADCDDTDADEHPGQVWYTDNDGDGYGTGATVVQCLRPVNGYLTAELVAITGDCNDNNAAINPVSQIVSYSNSANYSTALVYPLSGTSYTNFTFEVVYTDATNSLPPATYPRAILDYEGNGNYNNINDRVVILNPFDVNDINTADGKKYVGTINSLSAGTNWQTIVQVVNGSCVTQTGPFNYPDVLVLPDLQIFANDITFSSANPPAGSSQTVTAVIHNVSDFAAQNFLVHMVNQYDNSSPSDILVSNLPPQSSQTVSWTITTPVVPAWCPIQVSVDFTDVIDESNELDNSALRPFINGNFNLPGGITVVHASASPSTSWASSGNNTLISGRALYYGTPVPLADSSVAGGSVSFTILETGATFTTTTNSQGYFSIAVPTPLGLGTYHVSGAVTDFTLTGNFTTSFMVISPPACLPDLRTSIHVSSATIVAGNSITGSISVHNYGCTGTAVATLLDASQTGGTPVIPDGTVPPLAAGATHTIPFAAITFNTPGSYTICGTADGTNVVDESNEGNNTSCRVITVIPALPDIYPASGPGGSQYICTAGSSIGFSVGNAGGTATGPFTCEVVVKHNNVYLTTFSQFVSSIPAFGNTSFSFPFSFSLTGNYTFEMSCDVPMPNGLVVETNENNNQATFQHVINNCLPDLVLGSCEQFDVQPVDPQYPGTVTYSVMMSNGGNAVANGPIDVRFQLSGGAIYNTQYPGNLAPGQSVAVSVTNVSVAPATQTLTATADPLNLIGEWNESNSVTGSLCHDFQPVPRSLPCGSNFWDQTYLVNQNVYMSVGLRQHHLYDASSVHVRFQVSGPGLAGTITLGDAVVSDVEQTCNCPRNAVLPTSFVFPQVGTYTFTITADPDGVYAECSENNNVLVVPVTVVGVPDMRILSQHINPSLLNPQPGQPISMDITYENTGISNIATQMELKVLVDEVPLDSIYPVNGLVSGDNITIAIPNTWTSNTPGTHVIRAIIDSDNQVAESNEFNNQATRAVIVGEAANLYFQVFASSDPVPSLHDLISVNARIGNNGDLACAADVHFYYLTNALDTIHIGTIPVSVPDNDSVNISLPWNVLDPATTLLGRITNSSTLEFTYDDNTASAEIGAMILSFAATQSCNGGNNGTLTPVVAGGEPPYSYQWSNGYGGVVMTNDSGLYTLTVSDNTGQQVTGSGSISNDPGVVYFADADGDTYGNAAVTQVSCSGPPTGYVANDDDCDDANAAVHPSATEVCNGLDDDCDGLTDTNDPSLSDSSLPTITCMANIQANNDINTCGAVVTYTPPAFDDNCPGAVISQTAGLLSGSAFPVGTTTNTFVVTDFLGNTASCSFEVVIADASLPEISCPANISMLATSASGALVTYATPVGTDNCSGVTTTLVSGLPSGSVFPIGVTAVVYQVTDAAGLTATCSFTVDITGLPPQIVCPPAMAVNSEPGVCQALVNYSASEITGIPASVITYSHAPGSYFPVGTTTVTATATNPVGTSVCTFDVTVYDEEDPYLTLPAPVITGNDANVCGAVVNYNVSFGDNCSGAVIMQTTGLSSGSFFPAGTTVNTFIVTDVHGNSTTGSFTVTVNDVSMPVVNCPADVVTVNDPGGCGAIVTYNIPYADNCSGATIVQTSGLPGGSQFPIGTTQNVFVVTDASGNTASCSFTVMVTDDEDPVLTLPSGITVGNDADVCGAIVNYNLTFSDNCTGSSIIQTTGLASGSLFPIGTTTNTFVVTDASGNTTSGSFTVTVNDVQAPVISCPANMNMVVNTLGCQAEVQYALPGFTDNCPGAVLMQTSGLASGSAFPLGVTTNTFVVTDASGHTATCSFTVTVTNSKPIVTSLTSSAGPIFPVNSATTLTAEWGDEWNGGPYTITFIWNDGSANTVLTGITGNTALASHTYTTSAVFEPSVRVTDACGNISNVVGGVSTFQYLAVYVIGNQFTTMGGWFNTPAGSYAANPSYTGKVNMGNVVKPMNGSFKGELELNIKDYNFKVHAVNPTTWDYLTISGCCYAQFRGSCKVNGVAGYKVLVAQTDINYPCGTYGGNNMIRVKVWNESTGQVIYDTQPGDPDNAMPVLPLNGGAIQVHTQNNCMARVEKPVFDINCYPNPATAMLNIDLVSETDQLLGLTMFDVTGRLVQQREWQVGVGSHHLQIDVSSLLRGVYYIEVRSDHGSHRIKVVLD